MKLVKERLYEKFEEKSDPIHDMGIGVSYETLTPGAIIKPKKFVTMGRISGHIVGYNKGIRLHPTYYLTVIQVYEMTAKDRYFTCLFYSDIERAQSTKRNLKMITASKLYSATNKVKLHIKKQSFNNRFEIIEQGL